MPRNDLLEYYEERATEYDNIYEKPERQEDLEKLKAVVRDFCAGEHVLELAAGTGYWSKIAAETSQTLCCTDASPVVLERAKQRLHGVRNVSFRLVDAYDLRPAERSYTAVLCGFWWSHLNKKHIPGFLDRLTRALPHETKALFLDNRYVPGSSSPIVSTDSDSNTYQKRVLADGSEHLILKNFPSEDELRTHGSLVGQDVEIGMLTHYWWMKLRLMRPTVLIPGDCDHLI
jgi:demethylmenaquinone methyltransferase/2-methoxy-6-polyprenyl-1,4-benzoquinol methylase